MKNEYLAIISAPILGLNSKEKNILTILSTCGKFVSVAEISKLTNIPRTTLYPILDLLHKRRLVILQKKKRFTSIKIMPIEKIRDEMSAYVVSGAIYTSDGDQVPHDNTYFSEHNHCSVRIKYGFEAMSTEYASIAVLKKDERYFCIQSNLAMKEVLKRLTPVGITDVCRRIKKKGIIIDGLLQENSIQTWFQSIKELGISEDDKRLMAKEFSGRMANTHYISKEYFNSEAELWIHENTIVFFDWKNGMMVEITSSEIVTLIKDMYRISKFFGKKVDQNALLTPPNQRA